MEANDTVRNCVISRSGLSDIWRLLDEVDWDISEFSGDSNKAVSPPKISHMSIPRLKMSCLSNPPAKILPKGEKVLVNTKNTVDKPFFADVLAKSVDLCLRSYYSIQESLRLTLFSRYLVT